MAEREQGNGAKRTGHRLLNELMRIAQAERQLVTRSMRSATRASARSAALGGASIAACMLALGAFGAAIGLKLAGRPAQRSLMVGLLFTTASAMFLSRAARELPTETLGELRGTMRAQLDALKS